MKKTAKLVLAAMLVLTTVALVGCGSDTSSSTTTSSSSDSTKKDDSKVNQRAAFAAALIADEKFAAQFAAVKGTKDGKDASITVPGGSEDDALSVLGGFWDKDLVKKEYEGVLVTDAAKLAEANKEIKAYNDANKKTADPVTTIVDDAKLGNTLESAAVKFEDVKITDSSDSEVIEAKGLKYTVKKDGSSWKVVGKEGTLAQ